MLSPENLKHFPTSPGVYLMKNGLGEVLYVGKAKNLRNRVRTYFGARDGRYQIQFLMTRVEDVEVIVTDTEKEALILENTLIKQHKPRYNFNLRDDKTYFSLRLDMQEEFPRLTIIRKVTKDKARYFGPYSSASAAREVLKQLQKIFPLRHYPLETCRRRNRPCLFYQIKQCAAPCHGKISKEDYIALVEGASLFLEGKNQDLLKLYRKKMADAATGERYEEASTYRDLIRSVELTLEKQKMVSTKGGDRDIIGYHREGNTLVLSLMFIRGGSVTGSRNYMLEWELDDAEGIASFISEYYNQDVLLPDEVILPMPVEESEALGELLSDRKGKRVKISVPSRGTTLELVQLAGKNALNAVQDKRRADEKAEVTLKQLQEHLHLSRYPQKIECYDISNILGRQAVGSRVNFFDGKPDKSNYRRYRIRTVDQANDFAMMREVLSRRFHQASPEEYPDIIIVDGGLGQLNVLLAVLDEIGIEGVEAAALAKSRVEREMSAEKISRSDERVFVPGRKNPIILRQNSPPLLLLARIRDEAHRFAITYHQKVRDRNAITSALADIPGIGPKRQKALLLHFGSLTRIKEASVEEIGEVEGLTAAAARSVYEHLRGS